jgi:ABC-type multidrug transport system fused ATPase/permease subunit
MRDLNTLAWPVARLGEALEAMARRSGLAPGERESLVPPEGLTQEEAEALGAWIETAAAWLGLEAESVEVPYAEVKWLVRRAGPALLRLPGAEAPRFVVLLGGRRGVSVLGPDLRVHRLPLLAVRAALCRALEAPLAAEVHQLLAAVGVPVWRQELARQAILGERLSAERIGGCWLLRLPAGTHFWHQMRHARLPQRLLVLVGAHATQYVLWLLSWWVVGQGALQGRLERGWLVAWALLLLTLVPLRLLVTWAQGWFAIGAGVLLKRRLLAGALRLVPEEIRQQGAGQLLGRVIESEAVEALALSGGILGLVAGLELSLAAVVLGVGAGGGYQALLLLGWVGLTGLIGWRYVQRRRYWTSARLDLTHDLVERMVGHRTRLAQEAPAHWHDGEDQALARYLELARVMDRGAAWLMALVPRGWLLLGLLGLAPAFLTGSGSPAALAVGLGGILLAHEAFKKLATGLWHLAGAAIAWQQAAPLFHAAARPEVATPPTLVRAPGGGVSTGDAASVLEAHDLVFRYRDRGELVLRGCSLCVCPGDRLLLEGSSGGGKSTLAALLTGLRRPESGLMLLGGFDLQTLGGEGWRQRVVAAPQFHDNHVFAGTFAFNLLMGRRWPPRPEDIAEAEALCHELGLEALLERMPAGLLQMVGDTGWRLSHGEQSRLYLARALLQRADVVVLDESFAALDPETLRQALRCVLARAATLLVIAHP